ncbi:MAG: MBL fold metallo-hydrolase [Sciscionella sp.]
MASSPEWTESGVFPVAPGVHRIPLPLPNDALRAVNVYAIADGDGLVLIDSGWALQEARSALERAIGTLGFDFSGVRRFLITHMHRDHYTLAVQLRDTFGTRIALGAGEQPSMKLVHSGLAHRRHAELERWGAEALLDKVERARAAEDTDERNDYSGPDEWITGVTDIGLRSRTLQAVPTPGHTQGHLVFADREGGLLFAGDHVLPHITPSIGFEPARARLALGDYLDSLRLMRSYPDARLLPAHGAPGGNVHPRVDELLRHHEQRLAQTAQAVHDGAGTAFEVAGMLGWTRRGRRFVELDLFNQLLATGETAAHLDLLVARGELEAVAGDPVVEYRAPNSVDSPT